MTESSGDVIRVLLADDHAVVRAGIRELLERDARIQVVAEAQDGTYPSALSGYGCFDSHGL